MNDDKIRFLIKMGPEIQLVRRRKYNTLVSENDVRWIQLSGRGEDTEYDLN